MGRGLSGAGGTGLCGWGTGTGLARTSGRSGRGRGSGLPGAAIAWVCAGTARIFTRVNGIYSPCSVKTALRLRILAELLSPVRAVALGA